MKIRNKAKTLGGAQIFPPDSLDAPELATTMGVYRRSVASRYRAVVADDIATDIPPGSLHVSPKVDGELWYLVSNGGEVIMASPTGRVIMGDIPVLKEAQELLSARAEGTTIVAGELFAIPESGRPRVNHLAVVLGGGGDADTKRMGFSAFDLVQGGDKTAPHAAEDYPGRYETLERLLEGGKRCKTVKTEVCSGPADVQARYEAWVDGGKAEGLVVRDGSGRIYKVKPRFNLDVAIIGFTERAEDPTQARSILVGLMREDGHFQVVGGCGNLGSDSDRKALHKQLSGLVVESNFRFASGAGAMYRFVKPEVVVELSMTDIQADNAAGDPIRQPVLAFDDLWNPLLPMPGVSLLHPTVVRVRDDKAVNSTDVRAAQIEERCYVQALADKTEKQALPTSEILRREAYAKESKGAQVVRKLVVWKTNKEAVDAQFPAYVVHFTDYSPGRAAPLKHEVRVAPTEAAATAIADAAIAKNIKSGWQRQ